MVGVDFSVNDSLTLSVDLYFLSVIIIGSVIIYPMKNMAFIDALLFASGGATQSGLNTYVICYPLFSFIETNCFFPLPSVDINTIPLYQQIVIYLIPMITTPIFVNTCVVFVRLYWFEKRFDNIGKPEISFSPPPDSRH